MRIWNNLNLIKKTAAALFVPWEWQSCCWAAAPAVRSGSWWSLGVWSGWPAVSGRPPPAGRSPFLWPWAPPPDLCGMPPPSAVPEGQTGRQFNWMSKKKNPYECWACCCSRCHRCYTVVKLPPITLLSHHCFAILKKNPFCLFLRVSACVHQIKNL